MLLIMNSARLFLPTLSGGKSDVYYSLNKSHNGDQWIQWSTAKVVFCLDGDVPNTSGSYYPPVGVTQSLVLICWMSIKRRLVKIAVTR